MIIFIFFCLDFSKTCRGLFFKLVDNVFSAVLGKQKNIPEVAVVFCFIISSTFSQFLWFFIIIKVAIILVDLNIYWADVTFLTCKANYSQLTQKLILCIQIAKGQLDINRDSIVKHSWWHRVSNLQPSNLELLCFAAIPSYRIKSFSWLHNVGPSPLNC